MAAYFPCERCDFRHGDDIGGTYVVEKLLGEGTFGRVFRVRERGTGGVYAVKLLKLWEVPSEAREKLLKRFDMEYETGRIPSDYLVHSCGKGIINGNPYIVMEYCPGGDMLQAANSRELNFAVVAAQILYGLGDLHKCGKVHRDLKPENVLFRANGAAVLTDFGISGDQNKRLTERGILGTPKQIFGTYGYMPPEQVNPRRGDATVLPTTDIFSFGVMMYQMLTFGMPFGELRQEGDLPRYLLNAKDGRWDRTPLTKVAQGKQWTQVIEGCLEPDFKKRLQNVQQVLALLPERGAAVPRPATGPSAPQPGMQVRNGILLRVMQGEEYGRVYKLGELLTGNCRVITMGRNDEDIHNRLPIREEESCYVSRKHCTLELDAARGNWIIRDGQWDRQATRGWKNSLNGTYVNSTEVSMAGMPLRPGDIISVGDVKLRVEGY